MPNKNRLKNRRPFCRQGAETYLLLTLLSFGISVTVTRLFLELTGYPQIGNGDLHIAHVLWGGLFLFAACLLVLIIANRWVFLLGSILTGAGVGLFIDEVGKFVTRNNDYFFPSAAPIIYAVFLLTVLIFILVKKVDKENVNPRINLYFVLEDISEVLDHDLSIEEREIILQRLDRVIHSETHTDLHSLAATLKDYIVNEQMLIIEEETHLWEKSILKLTGFGTRWLSRSRLKILIITGLILLGSQMAFNPITYILFTTNNADNISRIISNLINDRIITNSSGLTWFQAMIGIQGTFGIIFIISAIIISLKKERQGILLAYIGLIFSLTIANILLFYFDQFSTIAIAVFQFIILLLVIRFKDRFLKI